MKKIVTKIRNAMLFFSIEHRVDRRIAEIREQEAIEMNQLVVESLIRTLRRLSNDH
jgi:hypothetical protein